ncbi:hypothetical protein MKQ70_25050 [Chitinophaga sedimenti]|uniref:hypothetical protein n=1 Tax=Chitinophaga sedimenti TaxID=2033606 RepID=UPI002003E641|nr:hypothetical protein [Chitinophaga sedimenti]MCK7558095.1 hypothetical protein [Chitinophaga sedimenti]
MKKFFTLLLVMMIAGITSLNAQNFNCWGRTYSIVVLGSSTAAGTGASKPDSAWVNIVKKYFSDENSPFTTVHNLAVAGTVTYNVQPSWYVNTNVRPAPNPEKTFLTH